MKKTIYSILFVLTASISMGQDPSTTSLPQGTGSPAEVTISGRVSDYEGNFLDSVFVVAMSRDFTPLKSTYTNNRGQYQLHLEKGKYMALLAVRMHEYPRYSELEPHQQRLEFWAWNFIANADTTFNMQYHRLEVYGLNVFRIQGATPGYTIYCRPMSLTRVLEGMEDVAPEAGELEVVVRINGQPVEVNMKQKVEEFVAQGKLFGYLLHVDLPEQQAERPFDVFSVFMKDTTTGDQGEAVFFREKEEYF